MTAIKGVDIRFNKFGTRSFTATTKVNDFISHLEHGNISGTHCLDCGLVFFPPRSDCYNCISSNVEWFDIKGTGTLLIFSKLQYAPVGFEEDLPYTIAVLDFGEYKVFGRIAADIDEKDLKVGMNMKVIAHELPNGQLNYIFQRA